jgi:holo-[acyl-carrier protein] synthase
MKPTPFPYPLNIGTDIVHLPRLLRLISRRNGQGNSTYLPRLIRRILCEQEQQDFRARFPSHASHLTVAGHESFVSRLPPLSRSTTALPTPTTEMARWLAGRFAAKEAARKASPGGAASMGWKDVLVKVVEPSASGGRPEVVYLGSDDGHKERNDRIGKLSISHDGDYVIAMVLAAG